MSEIVECHSEYKYAEKPIALTWQGRRLEVLEILGCWQTPGAICFLVKTADGQLFEVSYREQFDEWRIQQP